MSRHITTKGLKLIKQFEGYSSKIYLDSAGLSTIGYGHLILPHEKHYFKNGINEIKAETLLRQDLNVAENAILRLINVPLKSNQFDSLVSFTYNLGAGALQRSTLRLKVNRSEHTEVPAEFMRWVYAGGRRIPGLIKRRKLEAQVYAGFV